ncbi:Peroxiredoxin [Lishizhenia tianjinensis]|uniref:Peroxiredoxin n=1 Tax=Lishizhenia tianjinensis TaxID=477690 RepID=A0A1I7A5Y7_9FLAO|nr:TlpA disulfide reductase family protein [Lishizhenia tianjinensis]SFT70348.1 Peroxiredoxin [Lishizhenia tianjinensis]
MQKILFLIASFIFLVSLNSIVLGQEYYDAFGFKVSPDLEMEQTPSFYFQVEDTPRGEYVSSKPVFSKDLDSILIEQLYRLTQLKFTSKDYKLSSEEYNSYLYELYRERLDSIYVLYKPINDFQLKLSLEIMLQTNVAIEVYNYLNYHVLYTRGEFELLPDTVIGKNLEKWLGFSSKLVFMNPQYSRLLSKKVEYNANYYYQNLREDEKSVEKFEEYKLNFIDSVFNDVDRMIAMYNHLKNQRMNYTTDFSTSYSRIEKFCAGINMGNSNFFDIYLKRWFEKFEKIKPGSNAPNFTLLNQLGDSVSLDDYKGKLVAITFWGTWCGPCLESVPKYEKTFEKFSKDSIVFLNIALESDSTKLERWKKTIEEMGYRGDHLIAFKQFNNPELLFYLLIAAPSYTVIGRDGQILEPRFIPFYDERAIKRLKELLEQ